MQSVVVGSLGAKLLSNMKIPVLDAQKSESAGSTVRGSA
jgi:hypothetical protein